MTWVVLNVDPHVAGAILGFLVGVFGAVVHAHTRGRP